MISVLKIATDFLKKLTVKKADIERLRPQLAQTAQKVYDSWDKDYTEELGGGGICQDIADAMANILNEHGIEASPVSASVGEQHVYVIAKVVEGVFEVDINPYKYERGGGYNWTKIPNVKFHSSDISISMIHDDPKKYEECIEE